MACGIMKEYRLNWFQLVNFGISPFFRVFALPWRHFHVRPCLQLLPFYLPPLLPSLSSLIILIARGAQLQESRQFCACAAASASAHRKNEENRTTLAVQRIKVLLMFITAEWVLMSAEVIIKMLLEFEYHVRTNRVRSASLPSLHLCLGFGLVKTRGHIASGRAGRACTLFWLKLPWNFFCMFVKIF